MSDFSAHLDTFARDNLPPDDQWPAIDLDLPGLDYPARMNCATELLDKMVAAGHGARPLFYTTSETWSYGDLLEQANRIARVLVEDLGLVPGNGSTAVDRDMGARSAAVVLGPRRERGDHPICSFTAIGPRASDLVASQRPDAVWAPLEALVRLEGSVVLMGVDLTRLTLIHVAEAQAGRRPFVRWAHCGGDTARPVNVGGCSNGFGKLAPFLTRLRVGRVGPSEWTVLPATETLSQVTRIIESSPEITQCGDPRCERCRDAVAGGPLW